MSRQSDKNISFATFNLYNLQLPDVIWYHKNQYTQDEYAAKIEWSASMLHRLDADVIAFQELWSKQCLVDLFEAAGLAENYTLHFIADEWDSIAVAAAVRRPWKVVSSQTHKAFPSDISLTKQPSDDGEDDELDITINRFSRTILQLAVDNEETPELPAIQVFATHLKSKRPTIVDSKSEAIQPHKQAIGAAISTIRRTAEAAALRVILTNQMRHTDDPVVVLGDLNDGHLSNTLSIITQQPPFRMYEASRVGGKNDVGLYTVSIMQQMRAVRDVFYTHEFKGIQEVIDHVLVSEQFYDHSRQRIWSFQEMKIWNDYVEDEDRSTSDHGVVCARFLHDPS